MIFQPPNWLKKFGVVKFSLIVFAVILLIVYLFREPIRNHKYTRAKQEMFHRMMKSPPSEWKGHIEQVYDSIVVADRDSVPLE